MATDASINSRPTGAFKTYPEFSKLMLADREKYESIIAAYPPIEDISFAARMTWWNSLNASAVAELHGNLVISWWLPSMEAYSGLSIIGNSEIDLTICTIFDSLKEKDEKPRLVHVPEFVVANIEHPELYHFTPMRAFDEYIAAVSAQFPLRNLADFRQKRIRTFQRHTHGRNVTGRSLDLSQPSNCDLLIHAIDNWPKAGKGNNYSKFSDENTREMITKAQSLGVKNFCLFVDGELQAYLLFHYPADKRYVLISHARANSVLPHTFDYTCYLFCGQLTEQGIAYMNLCYDLDLPRLRALKLAFNPTSFFRKYIIEPAAADITPRG